MKDILLTLAHPYNTGNCYLKYRTAELSSFNMEKSMSRARVIAWLYRLWISVRVVETRLERRNKDVFWKIGTALRELTESSSVHSLRDDSRRWDLLRRMTERRSRCHTVDVGRVTTRSPRVAERSLCQLTTDATVRLAQIGETSVQAQLELDALRNRKPVKTVQHCTCLTWSSCFSAPTSRTAVFRTHCRRSSWYRGAPANRLLQ